MANIDRVNRLNRNQTELSFFMHLFKKAQETHKLIKVTSGNEYFAFNVNDAIYQEGGCGQCKVQYNDIYLKGQIYVPEDNYKIGYEYDAHLKSYNMMCECDDPEYGSNLLFDCMIDKPDNYLYMYYVDESNVKLIEKIEKSNCCCIH